MMLALSDYIVYHRKKDVKGRWRVLTMEKKNLSQQTMERLYNPIVAEKRMQPGDKLPNELELSEQLGVSRATLYRWIEKFKLNESALRERESAG